MPRTWTPEQKAAQAEKIRRWKPWENSTGPKTLEGKERAKMNAFKNGLHTAEHQLLREGLAHQRIFVRNTALYMMAEEKFRKILAERTLAERTIKE
jgi:hypothetical protein